jgi:hypothetical protein
LRLEPVYRLEFRYSESFRAGGDRLLLGDGRCEGRVAGRFRCANRARPRPQGGYFPDLHGAIETDDGATILVDLAGVGEPDEPPHGRIVVTLAHVTDDERYVWLAAAVCAAAGEARPLLAGIKQIVLDVHELVWEPLRDTITP